MSAADYVRSLYDYNQWANDRVLATVAALSEDELGRDAGASFGSIEANLAHILMGQVVWLARWKQDKLPSISELQSLRGLDALRGAFERSHRDLREYVASLTEDDLQRDLRYTDSRGNQYERPMWQLLLHLVNHGTHHRAETCMALATLGHPTRELDYHFFEMERS